MKKSILMITAVTMIILLIGACVQQSPQRASIALESLGQQGEIRDPGVSYQIVDNTLAGFWSVCIRAARMQQLLPNAPSGYALMVEGIAYPLSANPFESSFQQANIPDTIPLDTIRSGRITRMNSTLRRAQSRNEITMGALIFQKEPLNGIDLYEIETHLYLSLRTAKEFVYDDHGVFIHPSYVKSSGSNRYTTQVYLAARMGSPDPSVHGAFNYLKNHKDHASFRQMIYPNQVRMEDEQITIDPPHARRLRDLGPEGDVAEEGYVYHIFDDRTYSGNWIVSFKRSRLPEPLDDANLWKITIRAESFFFQQNSDDSDLYKVNIPQSITDEIEEIRNGLFEKELEAMRLDKVFVWNNLDIDEARLWFFVRFFDEALFDRITNAYFEGPGFSWQQALHREENHHGVPGYQGGIKIQVEELNPGDIYTVTFLEGAGINQRSTTHTLQVIVPNFPRGNFQIIDLPVGNRIEANEDLSFNWTLMDEVTQTVIQLSKRLPDGDWQWLWSTNHHPPQTQVTIPGHLLDEGVYRTSVEQRISNENEGVGYKDLYFATENADTVLVESIQIGAEGGIWEEAGSNRDGSCCKRCQFSLDRVQNRRAGL